jgi:hypothetical protein
MWCRGFYLAKSPRFRSFLAAPALQKSRKENDLGSHGDQLLVRILLASDP